jgi:hypothetical protein
MSKSARVVLEFLGNSSNLEPAMSRFIDVLVDEHEELPDGCCMRFRAQTEAKPIERLRWESESGTDGWWLVEGRSSDGEKPPARAYEVDDSSAGTSILVVGGAHGLRLTSVETNETAAEPYLLVSRAALENG